METLIKRGDVTIGSIHHELLGLGMEVVVETKFPGADPDGDTQFESFEKGENHLHLVYEAHCKAVGVAPLARPAKPAEVDPEADYYAYQAEQEAAEIAYHEAGMLEAEQEIQVEKAADLAAELPTAPSPPAVAAEDADDDLPF
jgi:hypothetical protein